MVLKEEVQHGAEGGKEGYYLRLSDTKDRMLRVLFFRINDPVIHCRIEHRLRPGAVAEITQALKEKGFSILTAYLAPSDGLGRSRLEVVVKCDALTGSPTSEIKSRLEGALRESEASRDLSMTVGYPRNYGRKWESLPLEPAASVANPSEGNNPRWDEQMVADLKTRHSILYGKVRGGRDVLDERHRQQLIASLIEKANEFGLRDAHAKSLFVSCHYKGNQLDLIEKLATQRGFFVFTGKDLLQNDTIAQGLLDRINNCSHYLGVWSREGAHKLGSEYWPSAWLLWEFGAAEAFGLEWRLLISKGIADMAWQKIAAFRQHSTFDLDFETKVTEILDVLWKVPATRRNFTNLVRA
jgi:hypothetical protein